MIVLYILGAIVGSVLAVATGVLLLGIIKQVFIHVLTLGLRLWQKD